VGVENLDGVKKVIEVVTGVIKGTIGITTVCFTTIASTGIECVATVGYYSAGQVFKTIEEFVKVEVGIEVSWAPNIIEGEWCPGKCPECSNCTESHGEIRGLMTEAKKSHG
jgi:hypothetical protein